MLNESVIKGKWKEIKGEISKTWGNLTNDDVEKTKGNLNAVAGLIQQKYGIAKEEASRKLSQVLNKFSTGVEDAVDSVSHKAAAKTEKMKQNLKKSH